MREKRVNEGMETHVGFVVGELRGLQQREAEVAFPDGIAILAVVEKGHSEACLAQVTELVSEDFVLCSIPGSVSMGGSSDSAALNVECGVVCSHIHGEISLEELLGLMPVYLSLKVDSSCITVAAHSLLDFA